MTSKSTLESAVLQVISEMGLLGKKDDFMKEGLLAIHNFKVSHPDEHQCTPYLIGVAVRNHLRSLVVIHD
ncbi:hypothetical protein [Halobacillus naozhouensis]|uniref:Uncharacterized protein n=1 Tax=Halobacillus naozhouensis TaxID=554880 RepID=A0ABY8IUN1_9BACI|nr:hypothetical protein [Halobacillus naozhouensis]WFT73833.1 hypothetical protein P9989_15865 [Halobacillus naozhouensis]